MNLYACKYGKQYFLVLPEVVKLVDGVSYLQILGLEDKGEDGLVPFETVERNLIGIIGDPDNLEPEEISS